jgi:hypothetical protein
MRSFRLMAITVLLLACVSLGSACTGAKGEPMEKGEDGVGIQEIVNNLDGTITFVLTNGDSYTSDYVTGPQGEKGDKGDPGAQGEHGVPGPSMIVAMGSIDMDGTVLRGYNVTGCIWNAIYQRYEITLEGVNYGAGSYVTVVTPDYLFGNSAGYNSSTQGKLLVEIHNSAGNHVQGYFSFMVMDPTLA